MRNAFSFLKNLLTLNLDIRPFIEESLKKVTPDMLRKAINENIDPYDFLFSYFLSDKPEIARLVKYVIRKYWNIIVEYLQPKKLYDVLSRNPENKQILDTPQGIRWLNEACQRAYNKLYYFVWSP